MIFCFDFVSMVTLFGPILIIFPVLSLYSPLFRIRTWSPICKVGFSVDCFFNSFILLSIRVDWMFSFCISSSTDIHGCCSIGFFSFCAIFFNNNVETTSLWLFSDGL